MKKIKIYTLILLALILISGCVGCSINKNYSVSDSVIYQVNDNATITVNKNDLFHTLLQNYGLTTALSRIDQAILQVETNSEGSSYWDLAVERIDDELNTMIYNTDDMASLTEEEKATLTEEFYDKMLLYFGFDEEQTKEYYTVSLARTLYERDYYFKDHDITDFSESDYQSEYNDLYPASYQAIILDYSSLDQCTNSLAQEHIAIKDNVWINTLTQEPLTNLEVGQAFIRLYNTINQDKGSDYMYQEGRDYTIIDKQLNFSKESTIGIYNSSSLKSIASSLENYINQSLTPMSYTLNPKTYNNGNLTILIYYIGSIREDFADVKDECYDNLLTTALTSTYQLKALINLRNQYHVYFNDSYLLAEYQEYLDEVSLSLEKTHKNKQYIAQSDILNLTAVQLYEAMDNYALIEITDSIIKTWEMNDEAINTVYLNGTVLDPTVYTECKNQVSELKDNFNSNTFEDNGYPKSFGWKNYIKEIYNVDSEKELILYFVSIKVEEQYAASFYNFDNHSERYMNYIQNAYDNYFDVDFTDVALVLYDADGNTLAYEDWTEEQKAAGQEFSTAIKNILEQSPDKLDMLYNEYRRALRYVFDQGIPCSGEGCESIYNGINLTKYLTMGFVLGISTQTGYTGGGYAEIDAVAKQYWTNQATSGISDVLVCANGYHLYIQKGSNNTDFYNETSSLLTEEAVKTYIEELDSTDDSTLNSLLLAFLDDKFEEYYEEYASSSYTNYCIYTEMNDKGWFSDNYTSSLQSLKNYSRYIAIRLSNYRSSFTYVN